MPHRQTADLETIVVDESWKKQALVVGVADNTPLELDGQQAQEQNGKRKIGYIGLIGGLFYVVINDIADRFSGIHPSGAPRRIFEDFPNLFLDGQLNREDLEYFAPSIETPIKFLRLKKFNSVTAILNRALEPYLMYAALRELVSNSDEKTVNFVYIVAHSDGKVLSNTALSKFGLNGSHSAHQLSQIENYLRKAPPQYIYEPAEISQRLRRGKGVNIIYVQSCSAGDLFEGINLSPRTVYIATSDKNQLDGSPVLNREFLRTYAYLSEWYRRPIDITSLKDKSQELNESLRLRPPFRVSFVQPVSPSVVRELNRIKQTLQGSDYTPFDTEVSMVIKGNVRLIF